MAVDLQDLERFLRQTADLGEEQLVETARELANGAVTLLQAYQDRRKTDPLEVTRKNDSSPELDDDVWQSPINPSPGNGDLDPDSFSPVNTDEERLPITVSRKPLDNDAELGNESDNDQKVVNKSLATEEDLFTKPPGDQEFPDNLLYKYDKENGSFFQEGIKGEDAQAILDLLAGAEGTEIHNGANLLITSKGKKLFETNAEGVITFSITDRDKSFARRGNPISNSINDLSSQAQGIIDNESRIKAPIEVGRSRSQPDSNLDEKPDALIDNYLDYANNNQSFGSDLSPENQAEIRKNRQDRVESLVYLRDNLPDGQSQELSDSYSVRADRLSDGIVELKMYEVDQPEPIVIGRVNDNGIVTQSKQYSAPRYQAVSEFIKNDQLARNNPGKAPITGSENTVDRVPDTRRQQKAPLTTPPPSTKAAEQSQGNSQMVGRDSLINLKNYYKNSPDGKTLPGSTGATARFNQQKAALLSMGKESSGDNNLKIADDFFNEFQVPAENLNLSPEEQADLQPAENFAASQAQQTKNEPSQRKSTKNVSR